MLSIPFTDDGLPPLGSPLRLGARGGWFHPTTGYTLPVAVRVAATLAAQGPARALPALAALHRARAAAGRLLPQPQPPAVPGGRARGTLAGPVPFLSPAPGAHRALLRARHHHRRPGAHPAGPSAPRASPCARPSPPCRRCDHAACTIAIPERRRTRPPPPRPLPSAAQLLRGRRALPGRPSAELAPAAAGRARARCGPDRCWRPCSRSSSARARASAAASPRRPSGWRAAPAIRRPPWPRMFEIIHAGSMIVDDIEDDSSERRGAPAVHRLHGLPLALNAGNWMYFAPFRLVERAGAVAARPSCASAGASARCCSTATSARRWTWAPACRRSRSGGWPTSPPPSAR